MVNGSFVFGLDDDGPDVFERTVEWGVARSLETATFHIMTPYPGTALHGGSPPRGASCTEDWDLYDTRHVVFEPSGMTPRAARGRLLARVPRLLPVVGDLARRRGPGHAAGAALRHLAYAGGWKKFEPLWDLVIRARRVNAMLPALERTLDAFVGAGKPPARVRDGLGASLPVELPLRAPTDRRPPAPLQPSSSHRSQPTSDRRPR